MGIGIGIGIGIGFGSGLPLSPPAAPTGLTATQDGADVDLTWTAVAGAVTYNIYRGGVLLDSAATNSYTDVAPGLGTFVYTVTAVNPAGESAVSNTDSVSLAGYTVTTAAPAATHTITSFGVSAETTIYWGDGLSSAYTGTLQRTHQYATAGTYTVVIGAPLLVTTFNMRDNKVALNSAEIAPIVNVTTFITTDVKAGTFDSADITAWRPTDFRIFSMPAGYAGTFDSSDIVAWNPTSFLVFSMPAGYAGTFDSADVSGWNPTLFRLFSMPTGYTVTISATGFIGFTSCNDFQIYSNGLLQVAVNSALWQLYQASVAPRTATGGTINIAGTNAAPSGTFQAAASCPVTVATPGKEVAHELANDGCAVGFNKWTTVTVTV